MKTAAVLFLCFILGLLCCGCDSQQEVGNYMLARQLLKPNDDSWPEVIEYTYGGVDGSKRFIVFIRKDRFFVVEE